MHLERTANLEKQLQRLKDECRYILPIDDETKQKEIDKAKSKDTVLTTKPLNNKDKGNNVKETIIENKEIKSKKDNKSKISDQKDEIVEDEIVDDSVDEIEDDSAQKVKVARINKEEIKDVKKATKNNPPRIKVVEEINDDFEEEEIEDEDFDEIQSNLAPKEKQIPQSSVIPNKDKCLNVDINKNTDKEPSSIKMTIFKDDKKPNAAPHVGTKVDVNGKSVIKPKEVKENETNIVKGVDITTDKELKEKELKLKQAKQKALEQKKREEAEKLKAKKEMLLKKKKQEELLRKKKEAKALAKKDLITVKGSAETKEQVPKPIVKSDVKRKTPSSTNKISLKQSTTKRLQQSVNKPFNSSNVKGAQTSKLGANQVNQSSVKNKNDKIKNRKLKFDANRLEVAKKRTLQQSSKQENNMSIPKNYHGDTDFMQNVFNFSSGVQQPITPNEELINGFKVYDTSKPTMPQKKVKKQVQQSDTTRANISPIHDDRIKSLYYPKLKEEYNVKDKKIEKERQARLNKSQMNSDENAYALYKQREAEKELKPKQNRLNFKPKRK